MATFRVEDGLLKVRYDQYDAFNNRFGHLFYQDELSNTSCGWNIVSWVSNVPVVKDGLTAILGSWCMVSDRRR